MQKPELAHHTLIAFLDKFVYRNAKAVDPTRGASIMQPIAAGGQSNVLVSNKGPSKPGSAINSASFWNQKSENVAVDDVFFHEYFAQIGKPSQGASNKKVKKTDNGSEDGEAENEDEIWDALVASRPEVQGDDSEDDDDDFADLMDMDDSGDDEPDAGQDVDEGMDVSDSDSGGGVEFYDGSGSEADEQSDGDDVAEKADEKPESARKARKKALKNLPIFASADDYADMLAEEED